MTSQGLFSVTLAQLLCSLLQTGIYCGRRRQCGHTINLTVYSCCIRKRLVLVVFRTADHILDCGSTEMIQVVLLHQATKLG